MDIEPIPAFSDNYIWCLHENSRAIVVDPGDAQPVIGHCNKAGVELVAIWITHHHPDHVGGVAALRQCWPDVAVLAPVDSPFTGATRQLGPGDQVEAFGNRFDVLAVPGHTLDHIAFVCQASSPPRLFCGDTLFAGGCGRVFEGSAAQMHHSLQQLAALPTGTEVYCAHEYTKANLAFARAVEPDNERLRQRANTVERCREAALPTLPSTIGLERDTNPFLRCTEPAVARAALAHGAAGNDPVSIFTAIRGWKDRF